MGLWMIFPSIVDVTEVGGPEGIMNMLSIFWGLNKSFFFFKENLYETKNKNNGSMTLALHQPSLATEQDVAPW